MNKISLIIQREYLTRVRKKSFIVMTILGPILMAALFIVPVYLSQMGGEAKSIQVVDETGLFVNRFENTKQLVFKPQNVDIEVAKEHFARSGDEALLYIPMSELNVPTSAILYFDKQPTLVMTSHISSTIRKEVESLKLLASGIDAEVLRSIKTSVNLMTIKLHEGGKEEKKFSEVATILGFVSAIMIYMFVFLFGSQVLRGVIEEKVSRIVEVIISSVKPFQLMMGKIVGVGLVGLTQFLLWIIFTFIIITGFQAAFPEKFRTSSTETMLVTDSRIASPVQITAGSEEKADTMMNKVAEGLRSINFGTIILSFLFYFIGGYLLYAALFAAIGAAVDNETDSQQFMLPITIPLILAIVMAQYVINEPNGSIAFWFSIIPLTSPVIMMIRIPFGVPFFDLALSMILLVLGFIGATWMAAKIYRTGILMYGKKVNYAELWKWIRYK
ncbi:MAG: ABC transporter permease [Bacteroidales bacterium]|nr:ABC transporter permease [Bacteroidales bacterium]MDZ4205291.1 ABC transporter permease [Bacteroidales bacterium]